MKRLCPLVLVIAAGATLVAGCGSSSSSSSTPAATSSSSAASASSSATANSSSVAAGATGALTQAVAICKKSVDAQASITGSLKTKLIHICDLAGSGNQAAVKKATHEVCVDIVKAKVPASSQQAAEAGCPAP
jgi:ABC-type phosphate transport system substrate-binding protein